MRNIRRFEYDRIYAEEMILVSFSVEEFTLHRTVIRFFFVSRSVMWFWEEVLKFIHFWCNRNLFWDHKNTFRESYFCIFFILYSYFRIAEYKFLDDIPLHFHSLALSLSALHPFHVHFILDQIVCNWEIRNAILTIGIETK